MTEPALRKALSDDTVFNCINKHFISLREEDVKTNNVHYQKALNTLIDLMKLEDTLFGKTFVVINFTGSYYKGTKVGTPSEFDLDVVIKLPMQYNNVQFVECQPGFTMIRVGCNPYTGNHTLQELRTLNRLIDNGYLNQANFRRWVEGIMSKVINKLPSVDNSCAKLLMRDGKMDYIITSKKSGPAFTVTLDIPTVGTISIDLVPALAFTQPLNNPHIRSLTQFQNKTWLAIPKPLGPTGFTGQETLYWRFSFYYQEKDILSMHGRVKPVIRQMKRLRDVQQWKSIASYYIETLFLNKLDKMSNLDKMPFNLLFYTMLRELHNACSDHKLSNYWDSSHNLFDKIHPTVMYNITMRLKSILRDIELRISHDSLIIAKYLLYSTEYKRLQMILSPENGEVISDEKENQSSCSLM